MRDALGSSFSKAHFVSDTAGEIDLDDPEFWEKAVGLKAAMVEDDGEDFDDDMYRGRARRVCGGWLLFLSPPPPPLRPHASVCPGLASQPYKPLCVCRRCSALLGLA